MGAVAASGQSAGSLTKEVHPKLNYQVCGSSGCKTKHTSVVIDSNWRWTHVKGETTNCYTGNLWDPDLCPNAAACSKNCEIEGADKEYNNTYGVSSSHDGNSLSLKLSQRDHTPPMLDLVCTCSMRVAKTSTRCSA